MAETNIIDIIFLVILVIGIIGATISLGYLWLKLAVDFHTKLMLTLISLQNIFSFLIAATSSSRMLLSQTRNFETCAKIMQSQASAFVGNIVYTSMISSVQLWKTIQENPPEPGQVMCIILFNLTVYVAFNYVFFLSLPGLENLEPHGFTFQCAAREPETVTGLELYLNSSGAVFGIFCVCSLLIWIRSDFSLLRIIKRRNNIGFAAQVVPWRTVTEEEYFTMPVNTFSSFLSGFLFFLIIFPIVTISRILSNVFIPHLGVTVWSCINIPTLMLLTYVRQRNISQAQLVEEELSSQPSGQQYHQENIAGQQPSNDIELEDLDEIRVIP